MIKAVSQRIGGDEALAILKEVNQQEAFQRGQNMVSAERQNGISIAVLQPDRPEEKFCLVLF